MHGYYQIPSVIYIRMHTDMKYVFTALPIAFIRFQFGSKNVRFQAGGPPPLRTGTGTVDCAYNRSNPKLCNCKLELHKTVLIFSHAETVLPAAYKRNHILPADGNFLMRRKMAQTTDALLAATRPPASLTPSSRVVD